MQLLVVEDDAAIGGLLQRWLVEGGNECTWVTDGAEGLELIRKRPFDTVILDVLLPGQNGLMVLRQLRAQGNQTPVILLTALGSVEERVAGLTAGADDYLVKPFAFTELMARIEAVCRRTRTRSSSILEVGTLRLDLTARRLLCSGVEIDLTPTECSLVEILMRHAGQVVTRKMLCEHLWKDYWEGTTNIIEVHINRLRGKLERGGCPPLIQTVRGRGYALRGH